INWGFIFFSSTYRIRIGFPESDTSFLRETMSFVLLRDSIEKVELSNIGKTFNSH
ncbi:hypothetical protein Csa_023537, partial [Cucumis sativus]